MSQEGAYLFDPAAFWADEDVELMSYAEVGMYKRLLYHQWVNGSIPADPPKLARLLCRGSEVFDSDTIAPLLAPLLEPFDPVPGDRSRLRQKRLHATREEWQFVQERNRKAGKRGAEKRWKEERKRQRERETKADSPAIAPPDGAPIATQIASKGKGRKPKGRKTESPTDSCASGDARRETVAASFERIWKVYPKKRGRKKAEEKWARMGKSRPDADEVIAHIKAMKRSKDWLKDSGKFVPYGQTYFNGELWRDDPPDDGDNGRPPQEYSTIGGVPFVEMPTDDLDTPEELAAIAEQRRRDAEAGLVW